MPEPLYALKEDLDMVTHDVTELKRAYISVDFIAGKFKDLHDEHIFQAQQVGRLENDVRYIKRRTDRIEKLLVLICQKLEINPAV